MLWVLETVEIEDKREYGNENRWIAIDEGSLCINQYIVNQSTARWI